MAKSALRIGRSLLAVILVLAVTMTSLVGGVGNAPTAHAAPLAQTPLITINLQGRDTRTDGNRRETKWSTSVFPYARRAEIVAVQEAGPFDWIPGTRRGPDVPSPAGPIRHNGWVPARESYEVYALETDPNGRRNNLALVTQRPANQVTAIVNPNGRAALGVRFNNDWYFTFHGQAIAGRPNDSEEMLRHIQAFVNQVPGR